jgi:hypothetical protein
VGLGSPSVKFLCAAKSLGVDFTSTVMIGRQSFHPSREALRAVFAVLGIESDASRFIVANKYGEEFFALLGAKQITSIDASDYEGACRTWDMNVSIPEDLREQFTALHDGGTLEHVFNIPQALKNCMEMIKLGGHFTQVSVANNLMGHGFWQLSPELMYRALSPANGFHVEVVLLHEVVEGGGWFVAADPVSVRRRVELCNRRPTYILTIAKRVAIKGIFASPPQQSDYAATWSGRRNHCDGNQEEASGLQAMKRFIPRILKRSIKNVLGGIKERPYHSACYRRIQERALLRGEW